MDFFGDEGWGLHRRQASMLVNQSDVRTNSEPFSDFKLSVPYRHEPHLPHLLNAQILAFKPESFMVIYSCTYSKASLFRDSKTYEYAWVLVRDPVTVDMSELSELVDKVLPANVKKSMGRSLQKTWSAGCEKLKEPR